MTNASSAAPPRNATPRTALFLPASNPRAITKVRDLHVDIAILDLEDAVADADKHSARDAAVAAARTGFGDSLLAIRCNGEDSPEHDADLDAIGRSNADIAVIPKAESAARVAAIAETVGKPVLVMIETPNGVMNASAIAAVDGVSGLIAGTNDLRRELRIPDGAGRDGLSLALQTIVLAARVSRRWAFDGVFNALDDADGLMRESRDARMMGFDGKTLIHPGQISVVAAAFGPTDAEVADAHALVAAAKGGAQRFRDRMIEQMHVDAAIELLERARHP